MNTASTGECESELPQLVAAKQREAHFEIVNFGAHHVVCANVYPDFVTPLAKAIVTGQIDYGIVLCDSGVGALVDANKMAGVGAGLIHDVFSARQGVDDDMNVACFGGLSNRPGSGRNLFERTIH